MKIELIWRKSWLNNDKDSFWVECTDQEVIDNILPLKNDDNFINEIEINKGPKQLLEKNSNDENKYCNFFLISKDLQEIKNFRWTYPYSGLWNANNPFEKIKKIEINNLKELHNLLIMEGFNPTKVLFIKLGKGNAFSKDCIENSYIKLDYRTVDHNLCLNKKWDEVYNHFVTKENTTKGVARSHTNQIKQFYEEDENTLWVTFHNNRLWWCFSKPEIKKDEKNLKTRPVIGQWSDTDILEKNKLLFSNLSGKLLKTQGFQGTICKVEAQDYTIAKIKGTQRKEAAEVEKAFNTLKEKLLVLIQDLQWQDFETLIDLIFRQMGWLRVSVLGENLKDIDIELQSLVTGEKAVVQIKAEADLKTFEKYEEKFSEIGYYDKYFFIASFPKQNLIEFANNYKSETNIYLGEKISELTISSGLTDWVINKTT